MKSATPPTQKEVTLADGSVHAFYFKKLGFLEKIKLHERYNSEDEETQKKAFYGAIADGLVEEDGSRVFTLQEAFGLDDDVAEQMFNIIMGMSSIGSKEKKA